MRFFVALWLLLRPWPNDQKLLVQQIKFACRAKCLAVWPRPKTLLVQHFCVRQAKNVYELFQKHHATNVANFACQAMFDRLAAFPTLLVKHFFCF